MIRRLSWMVAVVAVAGSTAWAQDPRVEISGTEGTLVLEHDRIAGWDLKSGHVDGAALTWSCETGRTGGGTIPQRWLVKPGSYREAAG